MTTVTTVFTLEDRFYGGFSEISYNEKTESFFTIETKQIGFHIKEWSTVTKEHKKVECEYSYLRDLIVSPHQQTLWVSDGWELVHELSLTGDLIRTFGAPNEQGSVDGTMREARFHRPVSLAIDKYGSLYVAEQHAIRKITKKGIVSTYYRTNTESTLSFAPMVYCNVNKCLYMFLKPEIWRITPQSAHLFLTIPNTTFIYMAVSRLGSLFYSSEGGICKIDPLTRQTRVVISTEKLKERLYLESFYHLTFDSKNHLYFMGGFHVYKLCFLQWKIHRLLWIAKLKNNPAECFLTALPKELIVYIREIMRDAC